MEFDKYHALGNDYIVLEPQALKRELRIGEIQAICAPHFGIGSDGILFGPLPSEGAEFGVRIFNPDGSEAEKSGNGLRIFARHLRERNLVQDRKPFNIETLGGFVEATVFEGGTIVQVDMGRVSFLSKDIPVNIDAEEAIDQRIDIGDASFAYCAATIGNPHCVIVLDEVYPDVAKLYGPHIELDLRFPNRTNVQFMKVLDRNNIQLEIWERGVGYTLASGSSSCAAGAVAVRLGLCDADITSHMPGGDLYLFINNDFGVLQTGPVTKVMKGRISEEIFN